MSATHLQSKWSRGHHGLSCKRADGRHPRHSQANIIIKEALGSAHISATREPKGLSRVDGKSPDGQTLIPLSKGISLVWDYTCSDTFVSSHIAATSKQAGQAALKAEKKKLTHYANLAPTNIFMPVAMETLGCFLSMSLQFIKDLGKRIIETSF